jgi:hypothetical protein
LDGVFSSERTCAKKDLWEVTQGVARYGKQITQTYYPNNVRVY